MPIRASLWPIQLANAPVGQKAPVWDGVFIVGQKPGQSQTLSPRQKWRNVLDECQPRFLFMMGVPRSDNLILKWYPNETAMEAGADIPGQKYPRPLMNDSIYIYT